MKSSRRLRLKDDARSDVREIRRYTARQWGVQQRDRYSGQLLHALESLLEHPERGRARDEYFLGCRSLIIDQHVAFYYLTDDEVVVVRILHGSRDATGLILP